MPGTHGRRSRRTRPKPRPGDVFSEHGLTRVINFSGTETIKGASPVCAEVIDAVSALVPNSVDMLELQGIASRIITRVTGAQAGMIAHCTAAGISMAVAGAMTGADWKRMRQLPSIRGLKNEVIIQRGHRIDYGGDIAQNVRLTGARLIEIGTTAECTEADLMAAFSGKTVAALFVVSHHTAPRGMIELDKFCATCAERGVPVVVDAAAEPDPRPFLRAGAGLVLVSLHKQFASLTGSMIAGRTEWVRACLYQESGIARPMKAGKETVIAGIAALQRWRRRDPKAVGRALNARLERARKQLGSLRGIAVSIEPDATSRRFSRVHLVVDPGLLGRDAAQVAALLAGQDPSIYVRLDEHRANTIQLDLRRANDADTDLVVARLAAVVRGARKKAPARGQRARASLGTPWIERLARFGER